MNDGMAGMSIEVVGDRILTTVTLDGGRQLCFVSDEKSMVKQMMMYRRALAMLRGLVDEDLMDKLVLHAEEESTGQETTGASSQSDPG